jgi:hypothetical protein
MYSRTKIFFDFKAVFRPRAGYPAFGSIIQACNHGQSDREGFTGVFGSLEMYPRVASIRSRSFLHQMSH